MGTTKDIEKFDEQIEITFSLFDAIEKSAERYVDGMWRQRNVAIDKLNESITLHNRLVEKRLKMISKLCEEVKESNDKVQRAYERTIEICELLQKRLDEALDEEMEEE